MARRGPPHPVHVPPGGTQEVRASGMPARSVKHDNSNPEKLSLHHKGQTVARSDYSVRLNVISSRSMNITIIIPYNNFYITIIIYF